MNESLPLSSCLDWLFRLTGFVADLLAIIGSLGHFSTSPGGLYLPPKILPLIAFIGMLATGVAWWTWIFPRSLNTVRAWVTFLVGQSTVIAILMWFLCEENTLQCWVLGVLCLIITAFCSWWIYQVLPS